MKKILNLILITVFLLPQQAQQAQALRPMATHAEQERAEITRKSLVCHALFDDIANLLASVEYFYLCLKKIPQREPHSIPEEDFNLVFDSAKRLSNFLHHVRKTGSFSHSLMVEEFSKAANSDVLSALKRLEEAFDEFKRSLNEKHVNDRDNRHLDALGKVFLKLKTTIEIIQAQILFLERKNTTKIVRLSEVLEYLKARSQLLPKSISIFKHVNISPAPDFIQVKINHILLHRALGEIIKNAYENNEGKEDLSIDLSCRYSVDNNVEIIIKDNGKGLPQHLQDAGQELLFSLEGTTKKESGGVGMAEAKIIITDAGGTIRAENRPEGGAIFIISLPMHERVKVSPVAWEEIADDAITFSDVSLTKDLVMTVKEAQYNGKTYMAKYNDLFEKEKTIPQANILDYLNKTGMPNISLAKHFIEHKGRKIILFELLPKGKSLERYMLDNEKISEQWLIEIMLKASRLVKMLHDRGIFHWDIKPRHIYITGKNDVWLVDFDLAFITDDEILGSGVSQYGSLFAKSEFLNRDLHKSGVLRYRPAKTYGWGIREPRPEHGESFPPVRIEIYSLAKTLAYALIGEDAHNINQFNAEVAKKYNISSGLIAVLDKALSDKECDYDNVDDFIRDLENCFDDKFSQPIKITQEKLRFETLAAFGECA
ncbi:MAG: ATP-binding protein [Candidatus Omnitrophota bacterium]